MLDSIAIWVGYTVLALIALLFILLIGWAIILLILDMAKKSPDLRYALIGYFLKKKNYKAAKLNLDEYKSLIESLEEQNIRIEEKEKKIAED